jgi:hypothetical protein
MITRLAIVSESIHPCVARSAEVSADLDLLFLVLRYVRWFLQDEDQEPFPKAKRKSPSTNPNPKPVSGIVGVYKSEG